MTTSDDPQMFATGCYVVGGAMLTTGIIMVLIDVVVSTAKEHGVIPAMAIMAAVGSLIVILGYLIER